LEGKCREAQKCQAGERVERRFKELGVRVKRKLKVCPE
jgi:hypothetical protein